uniref:Uncharacterized protein n=1 Tax=Romanomermis culicivorax TaxID=13658 RepID=A0A915HTE5_ROMCU
MQIFREFLHGFTLSKATKMSSKIRCSVKWDDGAGEPQWETWGVEWGVGAGGNLGFSDDKNIVFGEIEVEGAAEKF